MPSAYYRARRKLIDTRNVPALQWETYITSHSVRDENGIHIGNAVLCNLRRDGVFTSAIMEAFLTELWRSHPNAGRWLSPEDAADVYVDVCYRHQRRGLASSMRPSYLWHIIPERQFRQVINIKYGRPEHTTSLEWRCFEVAAHEKDLPKITELLHGIQMHPREHQIFATFNENKSGQEKWRDPEKWTYGDAATACAALGLSKLWGGYRFRDRIWVLKYSISSDVTIHPPTSADAAWRSIFAPSSLRNASYGRTVLLGPLRTLTIKHTHYASNGIPEVVHRCSRAISLPRPISSSYTLSLCEFTDIPSYPKFLGEHGGW